MCIPSVQDYVDRKLDEATEIPEIIPLSHNSETVVSIVHRKWFHRLSVTAALGALLHSNFNYMYMPTNSQQ